jgi:hypothetical protein
MGEDLGAGGKHPLVEVQQEMLLAANWLRSQGAVEKTQGLQRDIVTRLDQLINDLERQSPQSSSSSPSDSQRRAEPEQPQQNETPESPPKLVDSAQEGQNGRRSARGAAQPGAPGQNASSDQGPSMPGSGPGRNATVDLNDPRALQRSAWGSLPDRVRDQMQSRMVERFLPSYREEIEAYYRALVK